MKRIPITENTLNRLAKAIVEKHKVSYEEALQILERFRLNLVCGNGIRESMALQAALLTAVNTGKRAFHGGVSVKMPPNVICLLPWPGAKSLNEIVQELGADCEEPLHSEFSHTLYFASDGPFVEDSLSVVCSGWKGGIVPKGKAAPDLGHFDFSLGGVLAGAFGVSRGFLRVSGLSSRETTEVEDFSLWRPDLDWGDTDAEGPELQFLPKRLWMLGLGHLGQAYLWNLALLPYEKPSEVQFLLQDFDIAVQGNFTAQLLCEEKNVGIKKTRFSAEFLEARGFETTICERPFDATTKRQGEEPFVALAGFDAALQRRLLESAGFDLVVECGLGGDGRTFDKILLHTFPNASRKASDIWAEIDAPKFSKEIRDAFETEQDCGILADTLAKKAVSTSFVGAFAGALAIGELLRALHGGIRFEFIHAHLRVLEPLRTIQNENNYQRMVARSGFSSAENLSRLAA